MQFEKCNRREHCITPMGQLKLSDGDVPILPLKFSVSCQCLCLHSMGRVRVSVRLCEFRASERKAQQMGCMSPCTAQAINPVKAIYSDGFQTSQYKERCIYFHAGVTAQNMW